MGQVSNVGCHKHTLLQVGISVWIGYPVVASKFMHWTNSFLPWTSNVLLDCNMVFCRPATWGCCFFSSCCVGCICACHWASLVTQEYSCLECWALFHPLLSRTSCQEPLWWKMLWNPSIGKNGRQGWRKAMTVQNWWEEVEYWVASLGVVILHNEEFRVETYIGSSRGQEAIRWGHAGSAGACLKRKRCRLCEEEGCVLCDSNAWGTGCGTLASVVWGVLVEEAGIISENAVAFSI